MKIENIEKTINWIYILAGIGGLILGIVGILIEGVKFTFFLNAIFGIILIFSELKY